MPTVTPFLWFDSEAEAAATLYMSVFDNAALIDIARAGAAGPVVSVTFELDGQRFIALNGGPHFTFSPAISLFVSCRTQEEVDRRWKMLSAGGAPGQCGWLKDRFGLSWQIVPASLGAMLGSADRAAAGRVMQAMRGMGKLDIAALERAFRDAPN